MVNKQNISAKCTVGQFWDMTADTPACTECPDHLYRTDDMSQFEGCRTCPTGQTHNSDKSGCEECGVGVSQLITTFLGPVISQILD